MLVPEHAINDFDNKMKYFYDEAEKDVAKRRQHFMDGLKARGQEAIFELSSTLPLDPNSSIFEETSEEFEGGKAEEKKKSNKPEKKVVQIVPQMPKVKGDYPRVESHIARKKKK